jgi:hypothetical protein
LGISIFLLARPRILHVLHVAIDAQRKAGFGALLAPFSASSLPAHCLRTACDLIVAASRYFTSLFLHVYKDCAHDPRIPNGAMRWIG